MDYVGIDHHRQYSHMTLMDEKRNIYWSVVNGRAGTLSPAAKRSQSPSPVVKVR